MTPSIGDVIAGKYRIERVLGQGGMGVVVVAMHDELDQRVAIKFLLPEAVKDAEWVARFSREAKAAAKIRSEHVVRVFDVGKLPDGAPFMVMEFLDGKDLQSILNDRSHFSVEEAVDFVLQACEALAEAHAAGIVHRDLKPANLFLAHRSDGSPCVKVLDFGISKVAGPNDVSVTSTQAIVGSPLYMSPEQMKAAKNVDKRSDIWSLGVLLQELVSGSPSFTASTSAELCALVLTAAPTPLRATLPTAPADLERIITRCLEKNPDQRYQNVGELARELLPLAPGATTSVDRILRLSGATTGPRPSLVGVKPERVVVAPSVDPQLSTTEATIPATTSSPAAISQDAIAATQLSSGITTKDQPAAVPNVGAATAAAWGAPAKPAGGSRSMVLVAGGVGLLLVLGIGGWAAARAFGGTSPTASATSAPDKPIANGNATGTGTSTESTGIGATTGAPPTATTTSTPGVPLSALPTATAIAPTATGKLHPGASATPSAKPSSQPSAAASIKGPPTVNTSGFGGRN